MTSRFVRVSWGLQFTSALLHTDTIKPYIQSFQKGIDVDQTTKMSESMALSAQDGMEQEIYQTIRTCDPLTKLELFDYLTGWIEYFKYQLNNPNIINKSIQEYNDKTMLEYEKYVQAEEDKFKQTKLYKTLDHLDFYEIDNSLMLSLSAFNTPFFSQKRLVQYRKFLEIQSPDLIDSTFLPKYMQLMEPIISRCIGIAERRLSYLKKGSQLNTLPIVEAGESLVPIPSAKVPQGVDQPGKEAALKLKTTLTSGQILYLFKTLKSLGIFGKATNIDLCRFLALNVSTKGKEELSAENMSKVWSSIVSLR